jgi:hypothetical protein
LAVEALLKAIESAKSVNIIKTMYIDGSMFLDVTYVAVGAAVAVAAVVIGILALTRRSLLSDIAERLALPPLRDIDDWFFETHARVQVSGTISETRISSIQFINLAGKISTTSPITNGVYSVVIVGGQSYAISLLDQQGNIRKTASLYVPSGVTTFHADF